ncbi:MAG: hypothetical protein M1826_003172 [Phylliscum demangeonii]|nr:MAG: hypothetical protein M1826_003172 [Phylliscum demangeonii]
MRSFLLLPLLLATAALAAPLPESASKFDWQSSPSQRYTIHYPHPDEKKLWSLLIKRERGLAKYFQCSTELPQENWGAYNSLFEYERHKSCMRKALADTDGGLPNWVKDTPFKAPPGQTAKASSQGSSRMPFTKESHQLGNQVLRWEHALQNDMRRLHLSKPVNAKAAGAEENLLLRAVE